MGRGGERYGEEEGREGRREGDGSSSLGVRNGGKGGRPGEADEPSWR